MIKGSYTGPSPLAVFAFAVGIVLINLAIYAAMVIGLLFAIRWVFFS